MQTRDILVPNNTKSHITAHTTAHTIKFTINLHRNTFNQNPQNYHEWL